MPSTIKLHRVLKIQSIIFLITVSLFVGTFAYAGEYDVEKSGGQDTVHVQIPPQSPENESEQPTKTVMAPTWPVSVPVRVPSDTEERPENPHAQENETPQLPDPAVSHSRQLESR